MAKELNGTAIVLNNTTGAIVGQGDFTHTFGGAPIEIGNKSYGDAVTYLNDELSTKQHVFSGELTYNNDSQFRKVRNDAFAGTQDTYTLTFTGSGDETDESITGLFVPTSLSDSIPYGAKVATSISFNSSGDFTYNGASDSNGGDPGDPGLMINLDFSSGIYEEGGTVKNLTDIVTYSRSSSATFVNMQLNEDGFDEYFVDTDYVGNVENLLTYSEQFDNADWGKSSVTVTADDEEAPDGTMSADKLTPTDGINSSVYQTLNSTGGQEHTFSVYLKNIDSAQTQIYCIDSQKTLTALWSGSTLTSLVKSTGTIAQYKKVGDFYRVDFTFTTSYSTELCRIYPDLGNGTGSVYAWGAQFTESTKALPYVKTTSAAVTESFVATARREYDPETGENLGVLIEGGSTNLLTRSEQFNKGGWTEASFILVTADAGLAPDGTMNAYKLAAGVTNSSIYQSVTVTNTQNHTFSVYLKNISSTRSDLRCVASNKAVSIHWSGNTITALTGASGGATASYKKVGDFYRIELNFTTASANEECRIYPDAANGNGTVHVWGAQLEKKPFATSYIRTEGAAVSRSADNMTVDSFSLPQVGSVSVTADYIGGSDLLAGYRFSLFFNDGTNTNSMQFYNGAGHPSYVYIVASDTAQVQLSAGAATDQATATTLTFKPDDFVLYRDGAQVGTDTSGIVPVTTKINVGSSYDGTNHLFGHIAEFSTYDTVLTAQEVLAL